MYGHRRRTGVYVAKGYIRKSFRNPDKCNVFQAEMLSIIKATELINEDVESNNRVVIYIDSQATHNTIGSNRTNSNVVDRMS